MVEELPFVTYPPSLSPSTHWSVTHPAIWRMTFGANQRCVVCSSIYLPETSKYTIQVPAMVSNDNTSSENRRAITSLRAQLEASRKARLRRARNTKLRVCYQRIIVES